MNASNPYDPHHSLISVTADAEAVVCFPFVPGKLWRARRGWPREGVTVWSPSSEFLRQRAVQIKGGSGSLVDDVMRLAVDAASGARRWPGVSLSAAGLSGRSEVDVGRGAPRTSMPTVAYALYTQSSSSSGLARVLAGSTLIPTVGGS